MQRILIIRFSSIGDIVLTSPVVRVLRLRFPEADIRFVTKAAYANLVENSPYINGVYPLDGGLNELTKQLKKFNPDLVVDLHHNLRTRILRTQIGGRWLAFNKLNVEKWLKVNLKVDRLPNEHIVDRYLATLKPLGIESDARLPNGQDNGLDLFFPADFVQPELPSDFENGFVALVVGAKYATKQLPKEKLISICNKLKKPIILIGGKEDKSLADEVENQSAARIWNSCGKFDVLGSAWLIKQSSVVITHDTGMMHIAAAFNKKIISVWGNTIPAFGMYPYMPEANESSFISEVPNLDCRPCSKIGYSECPKGHFDCMEKQDLERIAEKANSF